jgi:alkylation response protein AidB-like acyl-CoA dehydrogenase
MDLAYSDEQRMFADSANEVLTRRALKSDRQTLWSEMTELGWLALPIPEAYGGFGQGAADVGILTERFGRQLVVTQYVPALVLCGRLIASLATDATKLPLAPRLRRPAGGRIADTSDMGSPAGTAASGETETATCESGT